MLPAGTVLSGRYRILHSLAQGGMSNIYICEDLRLAGKKWVLKEMAAQYRDIQEQSKALEHFKREASLLANLEHRNLPKVVDYFFENGNYHFIMEFVEGEDLGRMISKSPGPISEKLVIDWGIQIATVLYFLHCRKPQPIIFRDIKPSNIMVSGNTVKLIDFGIARHFSPGKKGDTMRIGSPGYAPPEQYSGQTDPRSDIYSLGVTLYQLLTKYDPISTQTPFKFPQLRSLNPGISPKLAQIIEKAIQIDPNARYQNALDLKKDLQSLLSSDMTSPAQFARMHNVPTLPVDSQAFALQMGQPQQLSAGGKSLVTSPQQAKQQPPGKTPVTIKAAQPRAKKGGKARLAALIVFLTMLAGIISLAVLNKDALLDILSEQLSRLNLQGKIEHNSSYSEDLLVRTGIFNLNRGYYLNSLEDFDRVRSEFPDDGEVLLYLNNSWVSASKSERISFGLAIDSHGDRGNPGAREFYRGIALAQHLINKQGGIEGKKILIVPGVYKGKNPVNTVKELSLNSEILSIIGDFQEQEIPKVSKAAGKQKIPILQPGAVEASDTDALFYSLPSSISFEYGALGRFVKEEIRPAKVAFIYDRDSRSFAKNIFQAHLGTGIKLVECAYSQKDAKAAENIAIAINESAPSLITLAAPISSPEERKRVEEISKELHVDKISTDFLLPAELFYYWEIENPEKDYARTIWGVLPQDPLDKNPGFYDFMRNYYVTYGSYPSGGNDAIAYDCLTLLAHASGKNRNNRALIKDYLYNLRTNGTYDGSSETIVFKSGKISTAWYGVKRSIDGGLKVIKRINVP